MSQRLFLPLVTTNSKQNPFVRLLHSYEISVRPPSVEHTLPTRMFPFFLAAHLESYVGSVISTYRVIMMRIHTRHPAAQQFGLIHKSWILLLIRDGLGSVPF